MSTDDLMTAEDVAALLRVHVVTVRRAMARGEFGAIYRSGRKCVRIYRREFEAHVARQTEKAAPKPSWQCKECGYASESKFEICPECGEEA